MIPEAQRLHLLLVKQRVGPAICSKDHHLHVLFQTLTLPSLKLTAKAHENPHLSWVSYHQNSVVHFLWRTVSFREGISTMINNDHLCLHNLRPLRLWDFLWSQDVTEAAPGNRANKNHTDGFVDKHQIFTGVGNQ